MKPKIDYITLYLFFWIGLLQPHFFTRYFAVNIIFAIIICTCFLYNVIQYIRLKKYPSAFVLSAAAFLILNFILTAVYNGELLISLYRAGIFISILMTLEIASAKQKLHTCLSSLYIILTLTLLINLITYKSLQMQGLDPFLGIRTRVVDYAFPLLFVSCLLIFKNKNTKTFPLFFIGLIVAIANIYEFRVTTGIFGIFIAFFVFGLLYIKHVNKYVNNKTLITVAGIIAVLIIVFRVQNYFNEIIYALTGKDASFTMRTEIWDLSYKYLKEKLAFGHGFANNGNFVVFRNNVWQAHCTYLQVIYDSGIAGLFLLISTIFTATFNDKNKTTYTKICSAFTFALLVMMVVEIYTYYVIFFIVLGTTKVIIEEENSATIVKSFEFSKPKIYNKIYKKFKNRFIAQMACAALMPFLKLMKFVVFVFTMPKKHADHANILENTTKTIKNTKVVRNKDSCDLSIIVPAYNAEKYIEKCLQSLIAQKTNFKYEIVVVNDGSTDKTKDIVEKFEKLSSKIKTTSTTNNGVSFARNLGISLSSGKYISFVDSDDYVDENFVEKMLRKTIAEDFDMVTCGYYIVEGDFKTKVSASRETNLSIADEQTFFAKGYPWGKIIKRSLFENISFPNGIGFEDTIMCYLVYPKTKKIAEIFDALYYYVQNPNGQTNTLNNSKKAADCYYSLKYSFDCMKKNDVSLSNALVDFTLTTQCGTILDARTRGCDNDFAIKIFNSICDLINSEILTSKDLDIYASKYLKTYRRYDYASWRKLNKINKIFE